MKNLLIAVSTAALISFTTAPAFADSYNMATFTGNISPGNANVKAPFNADISQGGPITGSFIIDNNLIPSSASGFVNVFFSSFPDIADIPAALAFTINLGTPALTFTLADAIQNTGAIQFFNGQFRGFFFDADFLYSDNKPYRFDDQGGTWNIKLLDSIGGSPVPLTSAKVNGVITGMSLGEPYVPTHETPVPEPSTVLLFGVGLTAFVGFRQKF